MSTQTLPKREFSPAGEYPYKRTAPVPWLISHMLRYRGRLAIFMILIVLSSSAAVALPRMIGVAFNQVFQAQRAGLERIGLVLLGLLLVRAATSLSSNYLRNRIAQRLEYDVRDEVFASLLGKSQTFHNRHRVGDVMARITGDVLLLGPMFDDGLVIVFISLLRLILPIVVMGLIRLELLAAPLFFAVGFVLTLGAYIGRVAAVAGAAREQFGVLNASLAETLGNIELVKATAQEGRAKAQLREQAQRCRDLFARQGRIQAFYLPPLIMIIALALAFTHALLLVSAGQLAVGDLVAYMSLMWMLQYPTSNSVYSFGAVYFGIAGAHRILALINEESELDENKEGYAGTMRGEVIFQNVSFGYGAAPALKHISFRVAPGQVVAIVGQTGAGKTTLTRLLNRTYDAESGAVLIDGIDVRAWNLSALRSQIATIAQDIFLFSRSIADNIAFGLGQQANPAIVQEAAQKAQAHEFATSFKDGYKTIVGERGLTLSGGQRQRIAIARALLTDPCILILDDSTSAVDSATEDEIQKTIRQIQRGRTTFLITHRLAQIRHADLILVLRRGELVAQGTHAELMESYDDYRRMFAPYRPAASLHSEPELVPVGAP